MKEVILSADGDSIVYLVPDEVADNFIDYFNEHAFSEYKSRLIKNLGWTNLGKNILGKYKGLPYFDF